MFYENPIEYNPEEQENKETIEKIKDNFDLFDVDPKLSILEKNNLDDSDAKACFHYDEEKNGEKIEMTNKRYLIFTENINKETLPTSIVIHEIRHRIQRENQYERPEGVEQLKLFSIDSLKNTDNDFIKNALLDYINNLPDQVKKNPFELDAKITEKIICNLIEKRLITLEKVKNILKKDSNKILEYLLTNIK